MALFGDFVSGQPVSFQRMRALLLDGALQEGVVGALDFKVSQRAAGANMSVDVAAGAAWIQIETTTRNGLAHVYSDAAANLAVAASNATNPRVDQVIVRYNDTSIPTGSGSTPTPEVLAGTATAGATLDNRTGAATLPVDAVRVADVLVPAASTSVTAANIRDRRPWARGAFFIQNATIGADATNASATPAQITGISDNRIECSGAAVEVTFSGTGWNATANAISVVAIYMDGAEVARQEIWSAAAGQEIPFNVRHLALPTPGSHTFGVRFFTTGAGTAVVRASSEANKARYGVREIFLPAFNNNNN